MADVGPHGHGEVRGDVAMAGEVSGEYVELERARARVPGVAPAPGEDSRDAAGPAHERADLGPAGGAGASEAHDLHEDGHAPDLVATGSRVGIDAGARRQGSEQTEEGEKREGGAAE